MTKENTMWKLFWALYNDLSALEQLKVIEMMIHKYRVDTEKVVADSEHIKEP
jgi:hypothetical protein